MTDEPNTLFLRLEGPLQAWGDTSKFVIRRTMEAPTKSSVIGLICCAMGLSREEARDRLEELNTLRMGVRVDRPGTRWWDYHTVGAKVGLRTAQGNIKRTASTGEIETLVTRREYLADASFLVALQGDPGLIQEAARVLRDPKWTLYLGRKSCPPSLPVFAEPHDGEPWTNPASANGDDLLAALRMVPWQPRYKGESPGNSLPCLIEWRATALSAEAPPEAEVWYDVPQSFQPPSHAARFVVRDSVTVGVGDPLHDHTPPPPRHFADYSSTKWRNDRKDGAADRRLAHDRHLCVFCKSEARYVHHITYRRAGGDETQDDLRSLCRLCHDAVTMIEYGLGMGLDRINPEEERWRDRIIEKREEIIKFRSLETRRRRLSAEEVE